MIVEKDLDLDNIVRGYAEFRDSDDAIWFNGNEDFALNIKKPHSLHSDSLMIRQTLPKARTVTSADESHIGTITTLESRKISGLTFGTRHDTNLQSTEIRQSMAAFSRYQYKNFALNSSVKKLISTGTGLMSDSMDIAPEYMLNNYITLKNIFRADIGPERTGSEFVLSVNPLGKKDTDRLRFEFAAGQTFDGYSESTRTKLQFNTKIKL